LIIEMLQSQYLTEYDLKNFGFKCLGKNVRISSDARIYGQENISIGSDVRIDDFVILSAGGGEIQIGSYIFIARNCHLSGTLGIKLNDFSSLAANTVIYSASDDYSGSYLTAQAIPQEFTAKVGGRVIIGRHVIIGSGSTIMGPCNIGDGCSIGAMTLINKDLDPWGIYIGIPARRLKDRKKDLLNKERDFLDFKDKDKQTN
jgi:dTDP-4-amino-4,6-dideoxy-D-glucose acyltransferase